MSDAQFIELLKGADKDQENSPDAAIVRREVDNAGDDQEQGPKPPKAADSYNSEVIEQESQAD
jgi:hypothetical protein